MVKLEGDLIPREARLAVVVSRFNDFITARLLEGAIDAYRRHGGDPENLTVAHVPGSFELPLAALKLARNGRYDAIACLGCIIKGQTDHYDHVAAQAATGVARAALDSGVPMIFGVITADTLEQAIERAGAKQGNQGERAMLAAIEMANLVRAIERSGAKAPGRARQ